MPRIGDCRGLQTVLAGRQRPPPFSCRRRLWSAPSCRSCTEGGAGDRDRGEAAVGRAGERGLSPAPRVMLAPAVSGAEATRT